MCFPTVRSEWVDGWNTRSTKWDNDDGDVRNDVATSEMVLINIAGHEVVWLTHQCIQAVKNHKLPLEKTNKTNISPDWRNESASIVLTRSLDRTARPHCESRPAAAYAWTPSTTNPHRSHDAPSWDRLILRNVCCISAEKQKTKRPEIVPQWCRWVRFPALHCTM